jgi:hypothetical protein
MTYGNFIINMVCHLMSLSSPRRNMALSMKVGMISGKLLCSLGTLFLLSFKRIVVKDINSH